jgi:[ribosomal protein S5]-alanine N-acetyltransferase
MEIETPGGRLRPFTMDDLAASHAYASDPEVCRYVTWGPNSIEDTQAFLDEVLREPEAQPRTSYTLAITAAEQLLGTVNLTVVSSEHARGQLGYVLRRDAWGRGWATAAATAMVRFGFEQLGLHRVEATCDPANVASARVLEKAGMTREGLMRDHMLTRGSWRDSLLYAAIRS